MSNRHQTDNYRYWHSAEIKHLIQLARNHSAAEVAVLLNRTIKSVKQAALVRGISFQKNPRQSFSVTEDCFIRSSVGKLTHEEIARRLNRTTCSISKRVCRLGLSNCYIPKTYCKYSDEDVELCRQLSEAGLSAASIAKKMEIPTKTVAEYIAYRCRINGLPDFIYDIREQR